MIEFTKRYEFEGSKTLQKSFPQLARGILNGKPLRQIARDIQTYRPPIPVSNYSIEVIVKMIRGALLGGTLGNKMLDGLIDEDDYKTAINTAKGRRLERKLNDLGVYKSWSENETEFIKRLHRKGLTRREVYEQFQEELPSGERSFTQFCAYMDFMVRKGNLPSSRLNWGGDIGFTALWLLERYGKEGSYIRSNVDTLNDYFFDGEERITRNKLNTFYRREGAI